MGERRSLAVASGLSLVVTLAYVVLMRHHPLAGDQLDYDTYGRNAADGHWFWLNTPYGFPHATAWKPPGYPAWLGLWYSLLGTTPSHTEVVQALIAPVTVVLTYLLAKRFTDDKRVRIGAAFLVAIYPMVWQYTGLLYSESIAIPLSIAMLVVGFGHEPTVKRAAAIGVLAGVNLLVRPTAFMLLAGVLAAWLVAYGWRRALRATVISVALCAVIIAPWAVRNAHVFHAFIPLSIQDMAIAGVFNPTSANDPTYPYAWRVTSARDVDLFSHKPPLKEPVLRRRLKQRAYDYIKAHPASVPKAFFWNGITRLWDIRRPSRAIHEAPFEGRTKPVATLALIFYYPLALLALVGLWTVRKRRDLMAGLLVTALVSSVVYTVDAGTRYRAPLEPVIVVLSCLGAVWLLDRRVKRTE